MPVAAKTRFIASSARIYLKGLLTLIHVTSNLYSSFALNEWGIFFKYFCPSPFQNHIFSSNPRLKKQWIFKGIWRPHKLQRSFDFSSIMERQLQGPPWDFWNCFVKFLFPLFPSSPFFPFPFPLPPFFLCSSPFLFPFCTFTLPPFSFFINFSPPNPIKAHIFAKRKNIHP